MKNLGMSKHRKSGHAVNCNHFTGRKGTGAYSLGRKQKLTAKQKRAKKNTHKNKYIKEK